MELIGLVAVAAIGFHVERPDGNGRYPFGDGAGAEHGQQGEQQESVQHLFAPGQAQEPLRRSFRMGQR